MVFWALLFITIVYGERNLGSTELYLSLSDQINSDLSEALVTDAFAKFDVDQDGFLSKDERKPVVTEIFLNIVQHLTDDSGEVVLRELFLNSISVPDISAFGDQIEDRHCLMEQVFQEMDTSSVWSRLFGETTHVPVEVFVDTLYERTEPDRKASLQQAINMVKTKTDVTQDSSDSLKLVKLDEYTKDLHNKACDKRRKLFVDGGIVEVILAIELEAAIMWVLETAVVSYLEAMVVCLAEMIYGGCQKFTDFLKDWAMTAVFGAVRGRVVRWIRSTPAAAAVERGFSNVFNVAQNMFEEEAGQVIGRMTHELADFAVDNFGEDFVEEAEEVFDVVQSISAPSVPGLPIDLPNIPCAIFC